MCNRANANKDGVNNMMYLSKGLAVQKSTEELRVSHCGKVFALGPEMARLWTNAQQAPKEVPAGKENYIRRLEQSGLAGTTKERGDLAHYRLLSGCIICPELDSDTKPVQTGYDGRIWTWIEQAGLRLTASELIRLEEQGTKPVPALLGEQGRQELTEQIYSSKELIWDGTLESEMERSPARDALVMSLLRLLRMGRLFLV